MERGVFARSSFRVSPGSLASVGYGARLLGARSRAKEYSFLGGVGSAASLAAPARLKGRVVLVVDAERDLNLTAVDGSLAALREFGAAGEAGEHCYHAVRICLCAALLHGKENFCERAGSIIHQLWDAGAGWHAGRIGARLQMRLAGLGENSPFREAVVREITSRLWEEGKDPFTQSQRGVDGPRVGPAPRPDIRVLIRIAFARVNLHNGRNEGSSAADGLGHCAGSRRRSAAGSSARFRQCLGALANVPGRPAHGGARPDGICA